MTDGGQVVTSSNAVTAYGQTVAVGGGTASPYGFKGSAGYRSDGDSPAGGSNYLKVGARYYDAEWGRFLTRDTDLSQKPYQYCGGDPVNFSDPSGHKGLSPGELDAKATGYEEGGLGLIAAGVAIMLIWPIGTFIGSFVVVAGFASIGAGIGIERAERHLIDKESLDPRDPPLKGIGPPGGPDTNSSNQDYSRGRDGKWYQTGTPYSGPPHGRPLPPGAARGN